MCRTRVEGTCRALWREKFLEVGGVSPWIHWWVRRDTLYSILYETGSQWSDLRMGVIQGPENVLLNVLLI